MRRFQRGFASGFPVVEAIVLVLALAGFVGWIINIIKLADACCGVSGMLVLRAIGIFVMPLGAILGFL